MATRYTISEMLLCNKKIVENFVVESLLSTLCPQTLKSLSPTQQHRKERPQDFVGRQLDPPVTETHIGFTGKSVNQHQLIYMM